MYREKGRHIHLRRTADRTIRNRPWLRPSITFPGDWGTGPHEASGDSEPSDVSEAEAFPPLNSAACGLNPSRKGRNHTKRSCGWQASSASNAPRKGLITRFQLFRALAVLLRCTRPSKVVTTCSSTRRRGRGKGDGEGKVNHLKTQTDASFVGTQETDVAMLYLFYSGLLSHAKQLRIRVPRVHGLMGWSCRTQLGFGT